MTLTQDKIIGYDTMRCMLRYGSYRIMSYRIELCILSSPIASYRMVSFCTLQVCADLRGSVRVFAILYGFVWVCVGVCVYVWVCVGQCGSLQVSAGLCGPVWACAVLC